ncbi:MAG: DNA gyrase subunit A [bacterium]|nr:DNA gyrase subunit A [bacterium]
MDIGKIQPKEITQELQESYLDYAMSVIVSRALPDVRDGLKPVHRRILFSMHELGLTHTAKFRKSALVVGDVLGKYHPHGDMAVYDSLARLAQDFSLRYPLIQGQGNFGSVDGDSPAAMRYTEARLTALAEEILKDLDKNTVDFTDNYDGTRKEPTVLPAKIPHLLLNGTTGIAVGMATSIPPHNLSEVTEAGAYLIDHPKCSTEDLLQFVKGPDFPTGGIIYDKKAILETYSTGKGAIVTRGRAEIAEKKAGSYQIIITEIPYMVNKANMIEKIADLVQEKKIEGIRDIRDESNREGMRVVIDLKNDAYPQKILNNLYKYTDLQKTFHLNMLALVDRIQPQILSLKNVLVEYVKHREEVIARRAEFDLAKAKERAHILEGLTKALDQIDAVIRTIKASKTKEDAQQNLIKKFKLTEIQANAILEMKLQTLAGLERKKIEDELKEKKALVKELATLLGDPRKILAVIKKDLLELKEKYGDERKTKVVASPIGEFKEEDLIPEEETIVTLTRDGYIKRIRPDIIRAQKRGGKGVIGFETKEEDMVEQFLTVMTHDNLLFFTNSGKVFQTKAYEIPEASRTAKGKAIFNFLNLAPNEKIKAVLAYSEPKKGKEIEKEFRFLAMATKNGVIKKTLIEDFGSVRHSGLIAIKLKKDDDLRWVRFSSGQDEIILVSAKGQSVRFPEKNIRPMGRAASGIRGMKLKKGDEVVGMEVVSKNLAATSEILVIMKNGFGKKTPLKQYRAQSRGGSGIKTAKITSKTGDLVTALLARPNSEEDLIVISAKGQVIRTALSSIPTLGRQTQGVRIMRLDEKDSVAAVTII